MSIGHGMTFHPVTSSVTRPVFGESPLWSVAEQALYFIDVFGKAIHRFEPDTGAERIVPVAEDIGYAGLWPGGGFITALRTGLWRLAEDGSVVAKLANNPEDQRYSRFSDGGIDTRGRLLIGTIDEPKHGAKAHLYRFDQNGLEPVVTGVTSSNGVAFSPDGTVLYHADTPRFVVNAYDYDAEDGTLANRRVFATWPSDSPDRARPDGAAVDAEGCYWTALVDGGRIQRYSPDGHLLEEHAISARRPTMVCFGGSDLKTLFVTTAPEDPSDPDAGHYPDAGRVFAGQSTVAGLAPNAFKPFDL